MVVVDGARKMINKTIDISVTSVHQTTAGKMIFGRYDERGENFPRPIAAAAGEGPSAPARKRQAASVLRDPLSRIRPLLMAFGAAPREAVFVFSNCASGSDLLRLFCFSELN